MKQFLQYSTLLGTLAILVVCPSLLAQDDPFGPFGGGTPATPDADDSDAPAVRINPLAQEDPVVAAIRAANPTTPVDLVRAMRALMDYDAPNAARVYFDKLLTAKPDAATMAELQKEYGSALFMQITRYAPFAPEGATFGRAVLDAAYNAAHDPVTLNRFVDDLSDPSLDVQFTALNGLMEGGVDAVTPMLNVLADAARADDHSAVRTAMVALGATVVVEPLIGALESSDDALRAQAAQVLGRLQARRATPFLIEPYLSADSSDTLRKVAAFSLDRIVGDTPARYDAEQLLYRRASSLFGGTLPHQVNVDDQVELWHWDETKKTSVPRFYPADAASLVEAARLANDLYALNSDEERFRRLYLMATLQSAKMVNGLHRPLSRDPGTAFADAAATGVGAIEDVLIHATKEGHIPAAIGAAEVLGEIGDEELLRSRDGRPRALASALRHSDRRLRFAATQSIMKINPTDSYAGSSHLPETLGYLLQSHGTSRVLIGDPQTGKAQSLVGLLNQLGYEADSAPTGRDVFRLAVSKPDYELILITDIIDRPDDNELIQMLRRDPRSANLPIGLMARSETYRRAKELANLDPLTEALPWPYDAAAVSFEVQRLLTAAGHKFVSPIERLDQADAALDAMIQLAGDPDKYGFYDLLRQEAPLIHALRTSGLSAKAATVLGFLGTPAAQRSLVDLASETWRPLRVREAAATAFAQAVKLRRTLLTTKQIMQQYDRYNQSEILDPDTQVVLGSILDTIEGRNRTPDGDSSASEPE